MLALIESIYERHASALRIAGIDNGAARMALWLALTELGERLAETSPTGQSEKHIPALAAVPRHTPEHAIAQFATVFPPGLASATTDQGAPVTITAAPADSPRAKRGGRKPGAKNKPKPTPPPTVDDIAAQLEAGGPTGQIDHTLIGGEPDQVTLSGRLRREESFVTLQHGIPTRVTRQHIELR